MSQLTLGVAVAQSETRSPPSAARSSPPSPGSVKVRGLALVFPDEELWRELSSLKERWLGVADLCLELGVPGVR